MKPIIILIVIAALLQGCASPRAERREAVIQPPPVRVMVNTPTPDPLAEQKLKEVNEIYDRGDYSKVVTVLTTNRDVWNGTIGQRLQAHKLLAFGYCLTRRQAFCEQQFGAALRLDPLFELKLAERNHPQWGPAFEKAKGSVLVQIEQPVQSARPTWTPTLQSPASSATSGVNISITPSTGVEMPKPIPIR